MPEIYRGPTRKDYVDALRVEWNFFIYMVKLLPGIVLLLTGISCIVYLFCGIGPFPNMIIGAIVGTGCGWMYLARYIKRTRPKTQP